LWELRRWDGSERKERGYLKKGMEKIMWDRSRWVRER
jgi:hypothetical protein